MEWEPAWYGGWGGWWGEHSCWGRGFPLQVWTLLVQGAYTAMCWHVLLKAYELLCLLDPALSLSFRFSPFLFFSPWKEGTVMDTALC